MKLTRVFCLFLLLFVACDSHRALAGGHGSTVTTTFGVNLGSINNSCNGIGELPFLDITKINCGWFITNGNSCSAANLSNMALDANGWPTTMVLTGTGGCSATEFFLVFNEFASPLDGSPGFPGGTYVLLHQGTGTFTVGTDCTFIESGGTGRDIYSCGPSVGFIKLSITATNASTPLKNFQMVYSSDSTGVSGGNVVGLNEAALKRGEIFSPTFLMEVSRFNGGFRFMDWFGINSNPTANWADRTPLGYYTWAYVGNDDLQLPWGVPFEIAIQLCNELNVKVCHLNVPIEFTDAAVTSYATLAHNTLRPSIKAAVEYGNEFFNASFPSGIVAYLNAQAAITGSGSIINQGVTRSAQVNDIWTSVYGADASTRLIRLLGGQNGFIARNTFIMDYTLPGQFTGAASTHADMLTVNTYFDFIGVNGYPIAWSAETDPYDKFFRQTNTGNLIPGPPRQFNCPAANCMSIASPGVVTWPSHGLGVNTAVSFTSAGNLPSPITGYGTMPYYVIAAGLTSNAFEFSISQGGAAVNTTGTQTGPQIYVAGCTSVGTSTAYTVSSNLANCSVNGSFPATPANGAVITVNIDQTMGASPTLAVDGGTAFGLTDGDGNALNGNIPAMYTFVFTNATSAGAVTAKWRYAASSEQNGVPPDPITSTAYYFGINYTNAQARGLGLQSYEGGQNFVSGSDATRKAWFLGAQYDQRMADAYINWATQVKAAGHGATIMHFNNIGFMGSSFGGWSLKESVTQPNRSPPKYNALSTFN